MEQCEKEYHYCELMFGGECWITKIYTVLAECSSNHYACCDGYQRTGNVTAGKNIQCVKTSGCGGLQRLTNKWGKYINISH